MNVTLLTSDGLALQGVLVEPAMTAVGAAIICHPHPAFGGTMDVWLLPTIASALQSAGWASLRFNFRGVGGSEGQQSGGAVEHIDCEAAVAHLRQTHPNVPVIAIGWSFGAMVSLRLAGQIDAWIGIGAPTRHGQVPLEGPLVPDVLPAVRTVIVGEHDQFFPPETADLLRPDQLTIIPGADHFLFDRDPEVARAVIAALPVAAHEVTS